MLLLVIIIVLAVIAIGYFISTQRSLVSLDEMFTDHAYAVDINADGSFEAQGLMG